MSLQKLIYMQIKVFHIHRHFQYTQYVSQFLKKVIKEKLRITNNREMEIPLIEK